MKSSLSCLLFLIFLVYLWEKIPTKVTSLSMSSEISHPILKAAKKAIASSLIAVTSIAPQSRGSGQSKDTPSSIRVQPVANGMALKSRMPTKIVSRGTTEASGTSFVRDAVRAVGPSVVRIDCEREIPQFMTMLNPEAFREGDTLKVAGSGFFVTSNGFLLTNQHVVDGAKKITVTLSNGRTFKAKLVSSDELTDLAVLKVDTDPQNIVKAPMGDSSKLQSGDWLIAVGCPVGLDFTVTLGIVSSPKRSAAEVGAHHLKGTYIQTDAALNSGNSGGPLLNSAGQVVGINTMVRTNTEAIGFAIPINRAREIFDVLKEGKKPTHAYFGVEISNITPDSARINNDDPNAHQMPLVFGATVNRVVPNGPASLGLLRKNDVIIEINSRPVRSSMDAEVFLDSCKPGDTAILTVLRGNEKVCLHCVPKDLLSVIMEKRQNREMVMNKGHQSLFKQEVLLE